MRKETGASLKTAQEIEDFIESFMDEQLLPFSKWFGTLVLFIALLVTGPLIVGQIVAAV